jgi:hypothetical protein
MVLDIEVKFIRKGINVSKKTVRSVAGSDLRQTTPRGATSKRVAKEASKQLKKGK